MPTPPLPTELLHEIGRSLTSLRTLAALASANRRLNAIFTPIFYKLDAQSTSSAAVTWAAEHGSSRLLQQALAHGATVPTDWSIADYHAGKRRVLYGLPTRYYFDTESPPHPLCVAVTRGHGEVVEILLDRGCCVRMWDHEGFSLLCLAVIHGHGGLVRTLLDRGALEDESAGGERPSARIGHRNSAIQIAAWQGRRDLVATLLQFGSEATGPSVEQMQHAGRALPAGVLASALGSGRADANYLTGGEIDEAPLYRAVLKRDEAMVRILAGPSSRVHRTRALERSVDADYPDGRIAQILLENGALPDFERAAGATEPAPSSPLIRAICAGQLHLVRLLVEYGANVNILYSSAEIRGISGWFVGGPLQLAREFGASGDCGILA
ncbi:ankyrin repeat-containing domain protein [Aspergillus cavernicola]|uniref:Ankyrin repeat-containing domain protein n=1 Tax=Aspergillus cavernicola TaxID=176166 RepID=A0ABR4IVA9_9EURO